MRVVGTFTLGGIEQVLLETPDVLAASAALRAAYVAAGWTDLSTTSVVVLMCHASHGSLQIMPGSRGPGRLRVLRSHDNIFARDLPASADCGGSSQSSSSSMYAWFVEQLPVLSVPPQTQPISTNISTPSPAPGIVAVSASEDGKPELTLSATQQNVIRTPAIDIAGLDAHFAARLREQGWQRDSGSSGARSATSVWYRTATLTGDSATDAQEVELAGTLTLQSLQDARFYIHFGLQGSIEMPLRGSLPSTGLPAGCVPLNDPPRRDIVVTGSRICTR